MYYVEISYCPEANRRDRCKYHSSHAAAMRTALQAAPTAVADVYSYDGGRRTHVVTIMGRRAYDLLGDIYSTQDGLAVRRAQ